LLLFYYYAIDLKITALPKKRPLSGNYGDILYAVASSPPPAITLPSSAVPSDEIDIGNNVKLRGLRFNHLCVHDSLEIV
jgi:hypothetical protein